VLVGGGDGAVEEKRGELYHCDCGFGGVGGVGDVGDVVGIEWLLACGEEEQKKYDAKSFRKFQNDFMDGWAEERVKDGLCACRSESFRFCES